MTRRPDENAAWRALRDSLSEDAGSHPAEELLLAYADMRSSLAADVTEIIETHLSECASCRDEVTVLGATTIWPSGATTTAATRVAPSVWQRIVAGLGGSMWRPALALAVLVVLMVPTLRLIGQDQLLRMDGVDGRRDNAMTVKEIRPQQASRTDEVKSLNGTAAMTGEPRAGNDDQARASTIAPTAPAASAKDARVAPPPLPRPAARANAAPSPTPPPRVADSVTNERQMLAARDSESYRVDAFAARAMRNQKSVVSPPAVPTFDYVPGGRVSIAPGDAERVMLRIRFVHDVSGPTGLRSGGAILGEATPGIVLAPTASEVDVLVVAADGRRNTRRVEVGAAQQEPNSSMVDIPLAWLAAGENRVEVVSREDRPRSIASPFVVTLQRSE